jgi:hypothetical protein
MDGCAGPDESIRSRKVTMTRWIGRFRFATQTAALGAALCASAACFTPSFPESGTPGAFAPADDPDGGDPDETGGETPPWAGGGGAGGGNVPQPCTVSRAGETCTDTGIIVNRAPAPRQAM